MQETQSPSRVLLVEDDAAYARLVALVLEDELGAAVTTRHASTLGEALETLPEDGADLVLLDLSLPDARGPEAVARFRAAWPDLPVLVLSGRDDPGLADELALLGATFLRKGEEFTALAPAVQRALGA